MSKSTPRKKTDEFDQHLQDYLEAVAGKGDLIDFLVPVPADLLEDDEEDQPQKPAPVNKETADEASPEK